MVSANQLNTVAECLAAIERTEMNPANVVGGNAAFFSGRQTELTAKAKRQVAAINRRMEQLEKDDPDDDE